MSVRGYGTQIVGWQSEERGLRALLPHSCLSASSRCLEGDDDGGHYDAVAAATLPWSSSRRACGTCWLTHSQSSTKKGEPLNRSLCWNWRSRSIYIYCVWWPQWFVGCDGLCVCGSLLVSTSGVSGILFMGKAYRFALMLHAAGDNQIPWEISWKTHFVNVDTPVATTVINNIIVPGFRNVVYLPWKLSKPSSKQENFENSSRALCCPKTRTKRVCLLYRSWCNNSRSLIIHSRFAF